MISLLQFATIECSKMCSCLINFEEEENSGKNIVYKVHESDFMIYLHVLLWLYEKEWQCNMILYMIFNVKYLEIHEIYHSEG